jgi:hypothetical protein
MTRMAAISAGPCCLTQEQGLPGWGGRIRTSAFRISRNCLERTCHMNRADHGAGLSAALLREALGFDDDHSECKVSNPAAPSHGVGLFGVSVAAKKSACHTRQYQSSGHRAAKRVVDKAAGRSAQGVTVGTSQ